MTNGDWIDRLVQAALEEDVGPGDWTTMWTVPENARASGIVVAKAPVVVSGIEPALRVLEAVDPDLTVEVEVPDGGAANEGAVVLRIEGSARSILTTERTALNFLGRLSGIATLTAAFARAVEGTGARVIDTRKTTPGWRTLEKAAVLHGGGANHRIGLHDMVLIKENHIAAAGGIAPALAAVTAQNASGIPVEIEVTSLEELQEALGAGAERVLLDNMWPGPLADAVALARRLRGEDVVLEASGNVSLSTVREIAETGVDLISVGALTHSAPTADLSLRIRSGPAAGRDRA
jgi:nicotinate-nucleotide pyrophosphorylase (carboxylating)